MKRLVCRSASSISQAANLAAWVHWLGSSLRSHRVIVAAMVPVEAEAEQLDPDVYQSEELAEVLGKYGFHFEWLALLVEDQMPGLNELHPPVCVDGNEDIWTTPPRMQWDRSVLEVYVWDATELLAISKDQYLLTDLSTMCRRDCESRTEG